MQPVELTPSGARPGSAGAHAADVATSTADGPRRAGGVARVAMVRRRRIWYKNLAVGPDGGDHGRRAAARKMPRHRTATSGREGDPSWPASWSRSTGHEAPGQRNTDRDTPAWTWRRPAGPGIRALRSLCRRPCRRPSGGSVWRLSRAVRILGLRMKRPYRVVVAKPGLDGHDRGAKVIARALRDSGFEVVYTGLHQTPEQVVQAVVQEDADAVGLSLLSGAHLTLVPKVVKLLADVGRGDVLVIVGGIIPEADIPVLKDEGVAQVFTPGRAARLHRLLAGRRPRRPRGGPRGLTRLAAAPRRPAPTRARATAPRPGPDRRHIAHRHTDKGDSTQSGPLRVPGQAVLRPLRHPDLPGRGGRHGGRGRRRRPRRPATRSWSRRR